jgi:hydrogenase maturation factor
MCLQIPLKVIDVKKDRVFVKKGRELLYKGKNKIAQGDYVYAFGNLVVSKVPRRKALIIRSAFKNDK